MGRDAQRRLYFALWPDAALRAAIAAATTAAVVAAGGRPVPAENLHVTLAFLGRTSAARERDAVQVARGIGGAGGIQRFDGIATWSRGGPLVLEAARVAAGLAALQAALANALVAADFALDRREFRPHITLAREPARPLEPRAASIEWAYREFVLVESQAGAAGSRYSVVEAFALAG